MNDWLVRIKRLLVWLLRPVAASVRWLQRQPRYRAWIKRFRPAFTIEEAGPRDMLSVRAHAHAGSATLYASTSDVTDYVAKFGQRVLGYVQFVRRTPDHSPHDGAWFCGLMVWGRYRGMGLGEAKSRRVIEQARREGASELKLLVNADNSRAIQLYRKLGFEFDDMPELIAALDDGTRPYGRRRLPMHCALQEDETNYD